VTKLANQLPKSADNNGLPGLNRQLVVEPEDQHVVIMVVDCKKTEHDVDSGFTEATARILRIEPITTAGDRNLAEQLLTAASDRRNGRLPLFGHDVTVTVNGQDVES
jgi:hypothetical protein